MNKYTEYNFSGNARELSPSTFFISGNTVPTEIKGSTEMQSYTNIVPNMPIDHLAAMTGLILRGNDGMKYRRKGET